MRELAHQPPEALVEPLTRREREVLALLAHGLSSPEIAAQLSLSNNSVKAHRQNIYGKLGVHTKRQALARAGELGLLVAPGPAPTLASAPPGPRHNLPLQNTRFFGREGEITQLQERLAENRLVTLTGSGGVGKTRLSLGVAAAVLDDFSDGAWLVELAGLADQALVPLQVAGTLDVPGDRPQPVLELVIDYLRQRQALLVLDNCEHLLPACAQLADALLRTCPQLQILATSREALGVPGEALYRVPSLPFPDPEALPPLEKLDDFTALRLFVDRARLVRPDYAVTPANAVALARVCQRLDGIPLAIEMAAARVDLLSTAELAERLDDVFRLLTAGSRTALPRHQTLRAAIDWSYQLLSAPERLLLQRLSVFGGGCTLAAAEAVCGGGGLSAAALFDQLASLVAKSLVIVTRYPDQPGVAARYHLLEMVRQFARELLDASGDTRRLLARHRDYFVGLAEAAQHGIMGLAFKQWVWQVSHNLDNLSLALAWAFSEQSGQEAADAGPRRVRVLIDMLYFQSPEALDWSARALAWCEAHPEIPVAHYARLAAQHAGLLTQRDLPAASEALKQAVALSRSLGPDGQVDHLFNLMDLGHMLAGQDEVEAAQGAYAEAEALLSALGPASLTPGEYMLHRAGVAAAQAHLANRQGRSQVALAYAAECLALFRANQDNWNAFQGFVAAGQAYLDQQQYEAARAQFMEGQSHFQRVGELGSVGYIEERLGLVEVGLGNLEQAQAHCRECLRLAQLRGNALDIASGCGLAAVIAAHPNSTRAGRGQPARSAKLAGASQALFASTGHRPWPRAALDTLLPDWRDGPEHAAIEAAYAAGQVMSSDAAVAYALSSEAD